MGEAARTPDRKRSLRDRVWHARIGVGPAFLFFATFNWVNVIVVPHAGDAIRDQNLLAGFLWFAAGMVALPWAGVIAMKSVTSTTKGMMQE